MKKPVSSELYDKEYYQKYNHGYDVSETKGDLMPELKSKFEQEVFAGLTVLDVGCGRGEFLAYAIGREATKAVGIDYSQASVSMSREYLIKHLKAEIEKVEVLQMDAKYLDFVNETFDMVVLLDIVEHLHDWELKKCVDEVHRVLKPNGKLFVHTSPNKFMMAPVRFIANLLGVRLKSQEFHVNEQTYYSLKKYFNKNFEGKLYLEKDVKYWTNQMGFRGNLLLKVAIVVDRMLDYKPVHKLLSLFPISILGATDLWFIGTKK